VLQASIDDLNGRLEQPLPMNRFRPNIVVADCNAWAEDTWERLAIGSSNTAAEGAHKLDFHAVKPCARCTVCDILLPEMLIGCLRDPMCCGVANSGVSASCCLLFLLVSRSLAFD
jgi:MOSC domain